MPPLLFFVAAAFAAAVVVVVAAAAALDSMHSFVQWPSAPKSSEKEPFFYVSKF